MVSDSSMADERASVSRWSRPALAWRWTRPPRTRPPPATPPDVIAAACVTASSAGPRRWGAS